MRELSTHQAFQTHCLQTLGVMTWMDGAQWVSGTAYLPPQPWVRMDGVTSVTPAGQPSISPFSAPDKQSFTGAEALKPVVDAQQKDASVADLKRQLDAAPEVIVEDLQPIEEVIGETFESVEPVHKPSIQVHLCAYQIANRLLLITDLPLSFNDQEALDKLALNMAKALLKTDISEWQQGFFRWPGKLRNPNLVVRQDWFEGAFAQFLENQINGMESVWVVLAGEHSDSCFGRLTSNHRLHLAPVARVDSLPQMLRIPELRKEAWNVMQREFAGKSEA